MNHIVKRGESLWSIAKSDLGDPTLWPQIARLNVLRSPYRLLIGQRLYMPERHLLRASSPPSQSHTHSSGTGMLAQNKASTLPGRSFLFVVVREVLPNAKLVRKVIALPETDVMAMMVNRPDLFGFHPRGPNSSTTYGEHALGDILSRYISASDKPGGAPNFEGTSWYIDVAKLGRAGAIIHPTETIIRDLDRLAKLHPHLAARIAKLKSVIDAIEGEVLIEGKVPPSAIQTAEAAARELKALAFMSKGARVLGWFGIAFTVYDLGAATVDSVQSHSIRPISAEAVRQVGGWGGAWAGMGMGFAAGAAFGIETGPGALLTGMAGGIFFGWRGYKLGDSVAKKINPN